MNSPQGPQDGLSMLNQFGDKLKIYPAEVKGLWRKRRTIVQGFLVLLFLILPWTQTHGVQTVLLQIPERRFALFGLTFFAHDGPLLFLILAIATLSMAFMTAVWGRVWCGWACPQTVFIDGLFRRIEFFFEGNHLKRRALDNGPFSLIGSARKIGKWLAFLLAASVVAHSFLAYFVGHEELLKMIQQDPHDNPWPFVFVSLLTLILAFDFGWFREQFCIIMCPYGRFQSVLQDRQSWGVMYDKERGEPRKNSLAADSANRGACVDCKRCVQVCPTGIDIRNGLQMECIACTACIDACDEIMEKVHQPKGLIRYATERELNSQGRLHPNWKRPRVLAYLGLILLAAVVLTTLVWNRQDLEIFVLRSQELPFQTLTLPSGETRILNHYHLHLENQTFQPMSLRLETPPDWVQRGITLNAPMGDLPLPPGEFKTVQIFVTFPEALLNSAGQSQISIVLGDQTKELSLVGPVKAGH